MLIILCYFVSFGTYVYDNPTYYVVLHIKSIRASLALYVFTSIACGAN